MSIPQVEFDAKAIRLERIFDNTEKMGYVNDGLVCEKVNNVYGKLMFGEVPEDRPITYASYVMSVDGKIAFEDNEVGPMIAKTNHLDKDGATADFWVLNLLRANCDGIIIGSGTMIKEPDYSGSAYDPDLLQARIDNGKSVAPWTVIVTTTGKNIPFGNPVFSQEEIPMLVATSEEGIKNLKQEITKEYYELPLVKTEEDKKKIKELIAENEGKIAVLVTGEGKNTDAAEMLKVLRAMGMEKVLVESPTYCHHMMREGLLDEIFINALRMGADAVMVNVGQGVDVEEPTYPHLAETIAYCDSVGLPVCSEPVPGGFDAGPEFKTLDNIARGARIACEIGCDFMKVGYAPGFERIVDETFVPLVVLGGAKTDNEKEFLASIKNAMDAGASGVAIGRNVWGGGNTVNMTRALAAIIHKDASVDEAYAILKGEK